MSAYLTFFYDNDKNDSRGTRPIENFFGKYLLHFSSEGAVDVAMTFFTIIERGKMYLSDVKGYLIYVFRELLSGNKNYETLIPSAVSI